MRLEPTPGPHRIMKPEFAQMRQLFMNIFLLLLFVAIDQ
jgi:hypothetical protein